MSTMGLVYNNQELLRTLQDNERNIIATNNNRPTTIVPKNNVSVINVNNNVQDEKRQQQQQQMPAYDPSRLKKHGKNGQPPPIAVAKRNARERNRVKQVNNGFATLRQHIPGHVAQGYGDRGKKLSKVETLRMAVEYIRGLQRLLAEADGLEYDAASQMRPDDSSIMIPSPTGSGYSGSGTHNGSGDVVGLDLDDEGNDQDGYGLEDDEDEKKDAKRFKEDIRIQNRLSENQNRSTAARRRAPQTVYYATKQSPGSFGDEENIEPLSNRNNNNNTTSSNNNNLLYQPIVLQSNEIKREVHLLEDDGREDSANTPVSPYVGEILIENPETGRFVPLKIEDQLVYVSAEGLPTTTYYRQDLGEENNPSTAEFMDVVSWWEQEQGRLTQRLTHV